MTIRMVAVELVHFSIRTCIHGMTVMLIQLIQAMTVTLGLLYLDLPQATRTIDYNFGKSNGSFGVEWLGGRSVSHIYTGAVWASMQQ